MKKRNQEDTLKVKQPETLVMPKAVVELAKEPEPANAEEPVQKIDFETWYVVRKGLIPAHHHREIIKADFQARKIPALCTLEEFDSALEKYGLKLK